MLLVANASTRAVFSRFLIQAPTLQTPLAGWNALYAVDIGLRRRNGARHVRAAGQEGARRAVKRSCVPRWQASPSFQH
jgi:hypothetical protein